MASKRIAKKIVANVTSDQFNEALSAYATAHAREQSINAKLDEQMTKLRNNYAEELKTLQTTQVTAQETVQIYCTENKDVLFPKKKSMDTVHGTVGFRTGTPMIKTLRGFTWASVLLLLKKSLPDYVRTKEEPNKELLLADRDKPEIKLLLPDVGIKVEQDETFFIELKKEESDAGVSVQRL